MTSKTLNTSQSFNSDFTHQGDPWDLLSKPLRNVQPQLPEEGAKKPDTCHLCFRSLAFFSVSGSYLKYAR